MVTPKIRAMTTTRSKSLLLVALIAWVVFSSPASAESATVQNCTWCHGSSAQGYTPAPRLAGQRQAYLEQQLLSFKAHTRDNPASKQYMWGAAANLPANLVHDLATYFATLPPKPANDGRSELVALGEAIYQRGMPDDNVVACVACHGPNAEGIAAIPRLNGLAYTYLKRRLEEWAAGYDAAAKHPMPSVARKLSSAQIDALASYLSFGTHIEARQ